MANKDSATALRVGNDGSVQRVVLERDPGTGGAGRSLREHIGCRVFDVVALPGQVDAWVDDEGMMVADPLSNVNPVATRMLAHFGDLVQPLFGTVVFAATNRAGDTVGLTEAKLRGLEYLAGVAGGTIAAAEEAKLGG